MLYRMLYYLLSMRYHNTLWIEPDRAREAVKKVMDNELFRKHYWTNDDEEDSNNESHDK